MYYSDIILKIILGGNTEGSHHFNDYYFRDSFEHSSSESQLTNFGVENPGRGPEESSHQSSSSHTPSRRALATIPSAHSSKPPIVTTKRFSILKAFIPSFLFVCFSLLFLTVLILECDWPLLKRFRQWPEIVSLHYHYYRPMKDYLQQTIARLF